MAICKRYISHAYHYVCMNALANPSISPLVWLVQMLLLVKIGSTILQLPWKESIILLFTVKSHDIFLFCQAFVWVGCDIDIRKMCEKRIVPKHISYYCSIFILLVLDLLMTVTSRQIKYIVFEINIVRFSIHIVYIRDRKMVSSYCSCINIISQSWIHRLLVIVSNVQSCTITHFFLKVSACLNIKNNEIPIEFRCLW